MKNILCFLIMCLCLQGTEIFAHPGGHYLNGEGIILNTWKLKSGEIIKGNFSFARDGKIFLEQENGIIKPVSVDELCAQDQKLARFKIHKFEAINNTSIMKDSTSSDGISKFLPIGLLLILLVALYFLKNHFLRTYILNSGIGWGAMTLLFGFSIFVACRKSDSSNTSGQNTGPVNTVIPKTNYTFIDSAYAAFKPVLSTRWDDTYFYVASNGIPNHNMMIGITSWQQQVPISQTYTDNNSWSIPLQPVYASLPLSTKTNLMKGAVAIAVNGIPIFNALNNRGEDSYKIGELDNWGGHCGRADDYHYHAAPLHLSAINGLKPIAFALDGFPVYGAKEPDGTAMNALDTCHGHVGSNGVYHYHGTTDYPYVVGAMKGKVTLDPSTAAPENQILPQAFAKPARPATTPLNGAVITDFTAVGANGYLLTYKIGSKNGTVKYSWDAGNKYTYILTDTGGAAVTNTYQR